MRLLRLAVSTRGFVFSQAALVDAEGQASATSQRATRRRLRNLEAAGFLLRCSVFARPLLDLSGGPLAAWTPGAAEPDYYRLAWQVAKRWTEPPRQQSVWCASPRTLAHFGFCGAGRLRQPLAATHDLHVTEIFMQLLTHRPADAAQWVGEDAGSFGWEKVPDGAIVAAGVVQRVLDFAGNYPVGRLRQFGGFFSGLRIPFEIW